VYETAAIATEGRIRKAVVEKARGGAAIVSPIGQAGQNDKILSD
jgi:hypothetical protein